MHRGVDVAIDDGDVDGVQVTVEQEPASEDLAAVMGGLSEYNRRAVADNSSRPLGVFAREDGVVVGGVDGRTQWGWLYVSHLWVDEQRRRHGLGQQLMREIEATARARGCGASWLDTFSFQAKPFYLSLGYQEFGTLADYPPGHSRHFLWKRLA